MSGQDNAQLTITIMSGPDDGRSVRFSYRDGDGHLVSDGWAITLGRRDDCDLCLPFDTQISRLHAHLVLCDDERWLLEDNGSRNGTYVGKKRVEQAAVLEAGVLFRIGRTWLRVENGDR